MADGTPIHYVDQGPRIADAVVLIPAEPFSCWFWQRNLPAIARHTRVIALDLRSRGESGKTDRGNTIEQFARDLQALLDSLRVERFVAVGWSIGGSVLWSYVELFGAQRVAGFINVDQRAYRFVDDGHLAGLLEEIGRDRLGFHVRRAVEYLGPEFDQDTALVRRMAYECLKTPTAAHQAAVESSYRSDFRATMRGLRVPTQLYVGRYGIIGPELAEELRAEMAAELVSFAHSGHMLPWTEPERFNAQVIRFAQRTLGAPTPRD
jgi:pimeloyl-ACP methyl ester carboxylesterase